jgi:hypothetical protein
MCTSFLDMRPRDGNVMMFCRAVTLPTAGLSPGRVAQINNASRETFAISPKQSVCIAYSGILTATTR